MFVNNYGAGGGLELPFGGMKGSGEGPRGALGLLDLKDDRDPARLSDEQT